MIIKNNFQQSHRKYHITNNGNPPATFLKYLRMRLKEGRFPPVSAKETASIVGKIDLELIAHPADRPQITWIGHSTVLAQYNGINFLTDPHLTDYPGPIDFFIPKRKTAPALSCNQLPKIDFVVISHNHYDHLDHRTVKMLGNSVLWYVPAGLKPWFMKQGIQPEKVIEFDWWQTHQFNINASVTFAPSVHWSKRTPWNTDTSLWGSWIIKIANFNVWFGGDTAYDDHLFKEIADRFGPFQIALIPIGAYDPRYFMQNQHLDPAQAVMVHKDLKALRSIPIHWGTFQLTHEPFLEPTKLLAEAMEKEGLSQNQFKPLKIGEVYIEL